MSRFFRFFKRYEEPIVTGHIFLGMMGGAFLATENNGDILDIALSTLIGGAVGNYPPMLWGVTAGVIYLNLNKLDPDLLDY